MKADASDESLKVIKNIPKRKKKKATEQAQKPNGIITPIKSPIKEGKTKTLQK